jgi:hypothetical protein
MDVGVNVSSENILKIIYLHPSRNSNFLTALSSRKKNTLLFRHIFTVQWANGKTFNTSRKIRDHLAHHREP